MFSIGGFIIFTSFHIFNNRLQWNKLSLQNIYLMTKISENTQSVHIMLLSNSNPIKQIKEKAYKGDEQALEALLDGIKRITVEHTQIAFQEITLLLQTLNPNIIHKVYRQLLIQIAKSSYSQILNQYILLWGQMYDGNQQKSNFPNLYHLFRLKNQKKQLTQLFQIKLQEFETKLKNEFNKVQFFDDGQIQQLSYGSSIAQNIQNIIYLDTLQIEQIKAKVEENRLNEDQKEEYRKKLKYFINMKIKEQNISLQVKQAFNISRKWAIQYLNHNNQDTNNQNKINQFKTIRQEIIHPKQIQKSNQRQNINEIPRQVNNSQDVIQIKYEEIQIIQENQENKLMRRTLKQSVPQYSNQKIRETPKSFQGTPLKFTNQQQFILSSEVQSQKQPNIDNKAKNKNEIDIDRQSEYSKQLVNKIQIKNVRFINQNVSQEGEPDLQIIKHSTSKKQWIKKPFIDQNQYSPQFFHKSATNNLSTPNKFFGGSSKKLSDFTNQKKTRKMAIIGNQLSSNEQYVIMPYFTHFDNVASFTRFRKNCLSNFNTIYISSFLNINCIITKSAGFLRIQLEYKSISKKQLDVSVTYKVPKCFQIDKVSSIHKHFTVKGKKQHIFNLRLVSFPLDACIFELSYDQISVKFPLPITMLSFVEGLLVNKQEWLQIRQKIGENNEKMQKLLKVDNSILDMSEVERVLQQFVDIGHTQGYSTSQYGALYRYNGFQSLIFLMKLSLRFQNNISVELVSTRTVDNSERQFLQYYLNTACMLIMKIQH